MTMESLRVSIDNGVTWTEVQEVRIIASDPLVENEVHITVSGEGVVTDTSFDSPVAADLNDR